MSRSKDKRIVVVNRFCSRSAPHSTATPYASMSVFSQGLPKPVGMSRGSPSCGVGQFRRRLEDVFVGKQLEVLFLGDKEQILAETEREQKGQSFTGGEFQMMVAVLSDQYLLDPAEAVCMAEGDLFRLAGTAYPDSPGDDFTYVPRIPHDAAMTTIFADVTRPTADPQDAIRTYAGYTDAELMRGKPGVRVR